MFGIIYVLVVSIAFSFSAAKVNKYTRNNYIKAKKNNDKYYFDFEGKTYSTKDNRQILFTYDNGNKVVLDAKTMEIIDNVSEREESKKREKRKNIAIKNNEDFYLFMNKKYINKIKNPNCIYMDIYQQISTDRLFTINSGKFYQDIKTDKLIKPVPLYDNKFGLEMMNRINKKIEEDKANGKDKKWLHTHFYG